MCEDKVNKATFGRPIFNDVSFFAYFGGPK